MTLREKVAEAINSKIATNKRKQTFHVYIPLASEQDKPVKVYFNDEDIPYAEMASYQGFCLFKSHWMCAPQMMLNSMLNYM